MTTETSQPTKQMIFSYSRNKKEQAEKSIQSNNRSRFDPVKPHIQYIRVHISCNLCGHVWYGNLI